MFVRAHEVLASEPIPWWNNTKMIANAQGMWVAPLISYSYKIKNISKSTKYIGSSAKVLMISDKNDYMHKTHWWHCQYLHDTRRKRLWMHMAYWWHNQEKLRQNKMIVSSQGILAVPTIFLWYETKKEVKAHEYWWHYQNP